MSKPRSDAAIIARRAAEDKLTTSLAEAAERRRVQEKALFETRTVCVGARAMCTVSCEMVVCSARAQAAKIVARGVARAADGAAAEREAALIARRGKCAGSGRAAGGGGGGL
jgi:hypothetical protein